MAWFFTRTWIILDLNGFRYYLRGERRDAIYKRAASLPEWGRAPRRASSPSPLMATVSCCGQIEKVPIYVDQGT